MKNLIVILAIIFIGACSSDKSNASAISKNNLTHKAFYWIGLDEKEDRYLLKDILGVDPVRTEWCAAFVNMVLLENDIPTSASVSRHPLTARSFLKWGKKVNSLEVEQGDILVFKRGNSSWQGHVGFHVSTTVIDGKLYYNVLGGNQGNEVSIDAYPASKLLSIRRF